MDHLIEGADAAAASAIAGILQPKLQPKKS
jgi:hypothetical protein